MYLHDQLVHKTIIEGCTGSRNHCTGFPDAPHRNLEKTALSEWNIQQQERDNKQLLEAFSKSEKTLAEVIEFLQGNK